MKTYRVIYTTKVGATRIAIVISDAPEYRLRAVIKKRIDCKDIVHCAEITTEEVYIVRT